MYIVDVVVNNPAHDLNRPFSYCVGGDIFSTVQLGARMMVPFGKSDRPTQAIVVDKRIQESSEVPLKDILTMIDLNSLVNKDLMELAEWMQIEYFSTFLECFKLVLPPGNFSNVRQAVSVCEKIQTDSFSEPEQTLTNYLNTLVGKKAINTAQLIKRWDPLLVQKVLSRLREENLISVEYSLKDEGQSEKLKLVSLSDEKYLPPSNAIRQRQLLEYLRDRAPVELNQMKKELDYSRDAFRQLAEKKVIMIKDTDERAFSPLCRAENEEKRLTSEQQEILEEILSSSDSEFLIHGVTGSGKTEIYLRLVESMLREGKDSIVLVPEISLTPQMLDRFIGRFGKKVAVLHSRLTARERLEQWKMIRNREVQIVVGARSAIFAPFSDLGMVIIDEEHESTFKSSSGVRYDTADVARKRVSLCCAKMVLGSATPDIRTYFSARHGNCKLLELKNRIASTPLSVRIVDMTDEIRTGNPSILSRPLEKAMKNALGNKQQIILFLNRKGYSTSISCRKCGWTFRCKQCDISLSYYRSKKSLKCSYCGGMYPVPKTCPSCGESVGYFGMGTEMVEEMMHRMFPDVRIARMDAESTRSGHSHETIYRKMLNREIDILIGTQMLSKGLDFPNVSLVGVLMADMSLNLPDYRAHERTFQLLTQVSGRAGRSDIPGLALIQTYNPENFVIQTVSGASYQMFYDNEIALRKEFHYPPFCHLILVGFSGEDRMKVEKKAQEFSLLWKEASMREKMDSFTEALGPNPSPIEWIKKRYRFQLLLKVKKEQINLVKQVLKRVYKQTTSGKQSVRIIIDVDPISIM